jgi:D-alanine-D-alanine ligase
MIIVLFGGPSDERHVSVASAQNIVRTLGSPLAWFWSPEGAVHDVAPADLLAHQRPFELDYVPSRPAIFPDLEMALDTLPVDDPVFLLALHGGAGEDGTLQRMLEQRGIPFTGSDSVTSANAFDKGLATKIVGARTPIAESRIVHDPTHVAAAARELLERHERIVLKPLAGGSSRGLFFINRGDAIPEVQVPYILEQFITGRELTIGVIDRGDGKPFALPVIEIEVDPNRAFDYNGKYLGHGTREVCPANIPDDMREAAQQVALIAHESLGCFGYSRTDTVAAADAIYYLETNTLPGLTARSLVPQQLAAAGIEFRTFLDEQVELGKLRVRSGNLT